MVRHRVPRPMTGTKPTGRDSQRDLREYDQRGNYRGARPSLDFDWDTALSRWDKILKERYPDHEQGDDDA